MKLVRLISDTEIETDYYCQFQEPFDIKPDSKISLQNFSVILDDTINVRQRSQRVAEIVSKPTQAGEQQVIGKALIQQKDYEVNEFIDELNRAFNAGLINPLTSGQADKFVEFDCTLTNDQQVNIQYNINGTVQDTHIGFAGINSDGGAPATYTKQGTHDPLAWAFIFSDNDAVLSKGQMIAEITFDYNGSDNGWAFGLAEYETIDAENTGSNDDSFPPEKYDVCIFAEGGTYRVKDMNGNSSNTTIVVNDGDRIQIGQGKTGGDPSDVISQTRFQVLRDGGQTIVLHNENYLADLIDYHVVASILTTNNSLKGIKFIETAKSAAAIPSDTFDYYAIYFSPDCATLLGYNSNATSFINDNEGSWTASNALYESIVPPTVVIEIPTLSIASYDSEVSFQRRRSIIAAIPSTALLQDTNAISYSQPYPVFLDIKNKSTQLINSLRVRILDQNDRPLKISTEGKSASVCVIFD